MDENRHLPNIDQISIIAATVILNFVVAGFITFPEQEVRFELVNIYIGFSLNAQLVIMVVASILAASGTDWLIRNHPYWNKKYTLEHWVTPLLSALVIGFLISHFGGSLYGWLSFFLGASLLMGILVAEYITVNANDLRYPIAVTLLLAISFLLYLIFCVLIRMSGFRLIFILPSIFVATLLVSLRSLRLRQPSGWLFSEALLISILTSQLAAVLHYWPIAPLSFGLALFGLAYSLFVLIHRLRSNPHIKLGYVEPLLLLMITWVLAYSVK